MSLPLENLDDKTYAELVRDARAHIPTYAPRWTDWNESDPGITFIELFAWLLEMQIYSLNRINDKSRLKFLKLLGIPRPFPARPAEAYVKFTYVPPGTKTNNAFSYTPLKSTRGLKSNIIIYPFGKMPLTGDIFYLSTGQYIPGVTVSLNIPLVDPKPIIATPAVTADLNWEYFNGSQWVDLPMTYPTSINAQLLKDSGTITFVNPIDFQQIVINGIPNYWIRVTLQFGNYGEGVLPSDYTPPAFINPSFSVASSKIPGISISSGQIYFEVDDDVLLTLGSDGKYTGIANATQGKTVTKVFDLSNTPNLGSPNLAIHLYERLVLQEYILKVKVSGENWQRVDDLSEAEETDKCYVADMKNGYILFGDGTHGVKPPNGADIYVFYRASEGFITRHLKSDGSPDFEIALTDRAQKGGCPNDPVLENIVVKVDSDTWTAVTSFPNNSSSKCYVVDSKRWIIKFGDGSYGMIPPMGASMTISYNFKKDFVSGTPQVTGSITRYLISPGRAGFRLNLLDRPEMLCLGDLLKVKVQEISVKVAGETWTWVDDLSTEASTSKSYKADLKSGLILFGDGTHGMVPPNKAMINIFYGGYAGYITRILTSTGSTNLQISLKDSASNLNLDSTHLVVKVNGDTWTAVSAFPNDSSSKCYMVDSAHGKITFGNGIQGMIPPEGASLEVSYPSTNGPSSITRYVVSTGEANFILYLLDSPQRDDLPWLYMEDLDASKYNDRHFTADPEQGIITFGNGDPASQSGRGRVPISSSIITVTYRTGVGAEGNMMTGLMNYFEAVNQTIEGMTVTNLTPAKGGKDAETLNDAIGRARKELLEVTRCITTNDYETLVQECPRVKLARVKALPGYHPNSILAESLFDLVSVVIIPFPENDDDVSPTPSEEDLSRVRNYLEQYRTLGTNLYVIEPTYTRVKITATVVRDFKYEADDVVERVKEALHSFLNPLTGGLDKDGWPFGRYVYLSEIMQVIDNVEGVDHVYDVTMQSKKEGSTVWNDEGVGPIVINSHELIFSQSEPPEDDHDVTATEAAT